MSKREFVIQYVLNAALGAGRMQLNVIGAIKEAEQAWAEMERIRP